MVFLQSNSDLAPYPERPSKNWIPPVKYSPDLIKKSLTIQVFRSQILTHDELSSSTELLNLKQRKYIRKLVADGRRFNEKVIRLYGKNSNI